MRPGNLGGSNTKNKEIAEDSELFKEVLQRMKSSPEMMMLLLQHPKGGLAPQAELMKFAQTLSQKDHKVRGILAQKQTERGLAGIDVEAKHPHMGTQSDYYYSMTHQDNSFCFYVSKGKASEDKIDFTEAGNKPVIMLRGDKIYCIQKKKYVLAEDNKPRVFLTLSKLLSSSELKHLKTIPTGWFPIGLHHSTKEIYDRAPYDDIVMFIAVKTLYMAGINKDELCFSMRRDVIDSVLRHKHDAPLSVLEVGTGEGEFVRSVNADYDGRVICEGITRDNLWKNREDSMPKGIKVLDFLKLPETYHEKYDIAVAWRTFIHMSDVGIPLNNMFAAVKPGGCIILDAFAVPNRSYAQHLQILSGLKKDGHTVAGICREFDDNEVMRDGGVITPFILIKNPTARPIDPSFNRYLQDKPKIEEKSVESLEEQIREVKTLLNKLGFEDKLSSACTPKTAGEMTAESKKQTAVGLKQNMPIDEAVEKPKEVEEVESAKVLTVSAVLSSASSDLAVPTFRH